MRGVWRGEDVAVGSAPRVFAMLQPSPLASLRRRAIELSCLAHYIETALSEHCHSLGAHHGGSAMLPIDPGLQGVNSFAV